jgi:DNA primase
MTGSPDFNDRVLSEIRLAADIVEIVGEHTALKKAGKSWKGLCPFHREKTPSFTVDRDRGLYYCFGCGAGGDVFGFVRQIERLDFREAAERLARRYGVAVPVRERRDGEERRREELHAAAAAAQAVYAENLWGADHRALSYLRERGVPEDLARRMGLGYAPDAWDFLARRMPSSIPAARLVEAGLMQPGTEGRRPYDRFRDRLLFPIRDERGRPVGFGGRSLSGEDPKYLNSPESPIFSKSRILYGLGEAREGMRARERAILVEGYFDHLAYVLAGLPEAVATMGTALTAGQARRLRRQTDRVVLSYDGDEAGRNATRRALPLLLAEGLEVSVVELALGVDPYDLFRESGGGALSEAVDSARHFLDWLIADRKISAVELSPEEKSARVAFVLDTLSSVPDRVRRYEYVRRLAEQARLPLDVLWTPARAPAGASPDAGTISAPNTLSQKPLPPGERRLLSFLVSGQPEAGAILESLDPEIWSDPRSRAIHEAVREAKKSDAPLDFSAIASHLPGDSERALLSGVALAGADILPEEDISSVINGLRRRQLDRRADSLQEEIARAEAAGDREEIERLYRSKLDLARQSQQLGHESARRNRC